jgi:hypothetical protein
MLWRVWSRCSVDFAGVESSTMMAIESRWVVAFSLATVICATGALVLFGLALLITSDKQSEEYSCPLIIGGGLVAFVGIGLLPRVASKLYESLGRTS